MTNRSVSGSLDLDPAIAIGVGPARTGLLRRVAFLCLDRFESMGHAGSRRVASTMTRTELLSIIRFVHKTRARAVDCLGVQCPDPIWNMVLFLLQQHLNDRLVTTSSLVAASGVPYATALRKINALVVSGLVVRRPRTRTGRSFSLHPSRELMARAEQFARHVKSDTGRALGAPSHQRKADGFYFGASYMAARI